MEGERNKKGTAVTAVKETRTWLARGKKTEEVRTELWERSSAWGTGRSLAIYKNNFRSTQYHYAPQNCQLMQIDATRQNNTSDFADKGLLKK